jgi:hypothetical protein
MQPWFSEAKAVPSLQVEVCFSIQERFYYGPDRLTDVSDLERNAEKLVPPRIQAAVPSRIRVSEVLGHERELAAYYQQIISLARHHKRPFKSLQHYFWLSFWLWNDEHDAEVSFPWYDSLEEISWVLDALVKTDSGLVHDDMDQGWEFESYAHDGYVYFLERNPDSDSAPSLVSVPRSGLVDQARQVRESAHGVVAQLSSMLGADYWTSHAHTAPAFKDDRPWWRVW